MRLWFEEKKAKKVKHLGYNFDSHLEARWATVFNELGICFNYEQDHFSSFYSDSLLPTTTDFFIPKWGIWFEAKNPTRWSDKEEREKILWKAFTTNQMNDAHVWVSFGGFGNRPDSAYEFFWVIPRRGSALDKYHNDNPRWLLFQGYFIPGSPVDAFWGEELDFIDQKKDKVYLSGKEFLIPLTHSSGFDFFWSKGIIEGDKTLHLGTGSSSLEGDNVHDLKPTWLEMGRYLRAYKKAKATKFYNYTEPERYQCQTKVWL